MSTENISISIDPSPLRTFVKNIISEELQPTLYGNDNSLAQVVTEEIDNNSRVHDRVLFLINQVMDGTKFNQRIDAAISDFFENGYSASRVIARVIDHGEVAAALDASDIASEISVNDIANEVDLDTLAEYIDTDALTTAVVDNIDYKLLARELITALMERPIKTTPNA